MSTAEVVCANRKVQHMHKPVALVLTRKGTPTVKYRKLAWSSRTRVLAKGGSHRVARFTCTAIGKHGLLCRVPRGGAISASATGISVLAAPATHST
jgi:hypothetical protein